MPGTPPASRIHGPGASSHDRRTGPAPVSGTGYRAHSATGPLPACHHGRVTASPSLIVGLRNPGPDYAGTRHNIGVEVLAELASRALPMPASFSAHKRTNCDLAQTRLAGRPVVLAAPRSFMNLSGGPVSAVASYFSVPATEIIVVHDEIDIEFGFALGELTPTVPKSSLLSLHELPAVERMAVCVRVGLPEEAHLATAKIGAFLESAGELFDGPSRELFLQLPPPERMHEAVVEMHFPVRAMAASA